VDKFVVLAISLSLVSLFFSGADIYWIQQLQPKEPKLYYFSVTVVDGGAYFRIYVQVNHRVVVADEDAGIGLYSFSASAGSTIEIKVFDENLIDAFTVEFSYESPYSLIQRVSHVSPIMIEYTVPS